MKNKGFVHTQLLLLLDLVRFFSRRCMRYTMSIRQYGERWNMMSLPNIPAENITLTSIHWCLHWHRWARWSCLVILPSKGRFTSHIYLWSNFLYMIIQDTIHHKTFRQILKFVLVKNGETECPHWCHVVNPPKKLLDHPQTTIHANKYKSNNDLCNGIVASFKLGQKSDTVWLARARGRWLELQSSTLEMVINL